MAINKDLFPVKAHYLLFFAGISPMVLFMATYAKQLGFSALAVGSVFTVLPIMGIVGRLVFGAIADRFQCHKQFVFISVLICTVSFYCLIYIPPINDKVLSEVHCGSDSRLFVKLCTEGEKADNCSVETSKENDDQESLSTVHCAMECLADLNFLVTVCSTSHNISIQCTNFLNTNNTNLNTSEIADGTMVLHMDAELLPSSIKTEGKCSSVQFAGRKQGGGGGEGKGIWSQISSCHGQERAGSFMSSCRMLCDSPTITDLGTTVTEKSVTEYPQLWMFAILMTTGWVGQAAVSSMADTICFAILGDGASEFGKQRLWGSLGWGLFAMSGGKLVDEFSKGKPMKDYRPLFYSTAILLCLDMVIATQIKKVKKKQSKSMAVDIGKMLLNVKVIIYLLWCIAVGFCNCLIGNFLFWHLEDLTSCEDRPSIKTLEGLYVIIQAFGGELPFFFLNSWLSRKLGHVNCMSLVLLIFGVKFIAFSMFSNPWLFLPFGLLNGMAFSTFYSTMTSYANAVSPLGTEATIQGLVSSIYEGIGVSFGSLIAGFLMHEFKGAKVFRFYGIIALVMCALHVIVQLLLSRKLDDKAKQTELDASYPAIKYSNPERAVKIAEIKK